MTSPLAPASPSALRTSSAERSAARALVIVEEALTATARRNERGVARVRIAVCAAFLLRELALFSADVLGGNPKDVVITASLVVAITLSALHLRLPERGPGLRARQLSFVLVDVALFAVTAVAVVLLPEPLYHGILHTPFMGACSLVIIAAGLRLHRAYAAVATGLVGAIFVGVCALDRALWPQRSEWGSNEAVFYAVLVLGCGVVAALIADRTRDSALRAAEQAIAAERARERFGSYVGREVAAEALAASEIVLGGRRQPVAVLFSDLRGFTSSAEKLTPEETVRQLNAYLEEMVAVIARHGGVVDKYMGDGIMAVFGAPRTRPDDAARAIAAAIDMQRALVRHNQRRALSGLPPLKMGIGVHYGEVVAGNVGTLEHASYTIIGDVVNLGSRLESATKDVDTGVLFSRAVVEAAGRSGAALPPLRALGALTVRGRAEPVEVFTVSSDVVSADGAAGPAPVAAAPHGARG